MTSAAPKIHSFRPRNGPRGHPVAWPRPRSCGIRTRFVNGRGHSEQSTTREDGNRKESWGSSKVPTHRLPHSCPILNGFVLDLQSRGCAQMSSESRFSSAVDASRRCFFCVSTYDSQQMTWRWEEATPGPLPLVSLL